MATSRPILVTGSHRSGTTWTGKIIALSPTVAYVKEPFNTAYFHPGVCGARFETDFTYVTDDNEARYLRHFVRTLGWQYNWLADLKTVRRPKELGRVWRDGRSFHHRRRSGKRPLLKDPLAIFSAEWLASRFDLQVIVLIRHPAAFVSSIKRFGWKCPIDVLLAQPLLMRDYLEPFRKEMQAIVDGPYDLVTFAAEFWKLVYYVVDGYRKRHADWRFVRHEDLSRAPIKGFRRIFDYLSLQLSDNIISTIDEFTNSENPRAAKGPTSMFRLNSRANIWNWKERLSTSEVDRVRAIAGDVASLYYTDDDW